jgi:hypothetical protein
MAALKGIHLFAGKKELLAVKFVGAFKDVELL